MKRANIRGQIAIFLALIFVVLFTLFGLTINVSMVVHDKINLQNSTDFASYYVAQKQAEMLNAIAHTNYQIRQSWKLFAFRYRVIGSIGRRGDASTGYGSHPGLDPLGAMTGFRTDEGIYDAAVDRGLCAAGAPYFFSPLNVGDYHCRRPSVAIPNISAGSVLLGGIGGAGFVTGNISVVNATIFASCESSTWFNWWYANTAFLAFKEDQKARRAIIRALAQNLSQPVVAGGMKDLDGNDVYEGAFKTFQYNLSQSNKEADENYNLVIENSLSGVDRSQWLPEVTVDAVLPYVLFSNSGGGCSTDPNLRLANVDSFVPPATASQTQTLRAAVDPGALFQSLLGYSSDGSLDTLSLGVEKNPWYMIYNKITAVTFSKALFTPGIDTGTDGQRGIRISATSYAKPFGGRIGPWYETQWSSGSSRSTGGTKTDLNTPPRTSGASGLFSSTDNTLRPNYSRYPGDTKGLTTNSAMVAVSRLIGWSKNASAGQNIRADDLTMPVYSFLDASANSDPLAQRLPDPTAATTVLPQDAYLRKIEIAAIAPDAFDITYYSVFPGFWDNFGSKLAAWLNPSDGLSQNYQIRGDLGFMPSAGGKYASYDIIDQMQDSQQIVNPAGVAPPNMDRRFAPWFVKRTIGSTSSNNNFSFLSGWNSGLDVMDYVTPSALGERFANCASDGDLTDPATTVKIPGDCLKGGRVGYSVKLISSDYLRATHPIGGGGNSGTIQNAF